MKKIEKIPKIKDAKSIIIDVVAIIFPTPGTKTDKIEKNIIAANVFIIFSLKFYSNKVYLSVVITSI
jgi:hypothetical protein